MYPLLGNPQAPPPLHEQEMRSFSRQKQALLNSPQHSVPGPAGLDLVTLGSALPTIDTS